MEMENDLVNTNVTELSIEDDDDQELDPADQCVTLMPNQDGSNNNSDNNKRETEANKAGTEELQDLQVASTSTAAAAAVVTVDAAAATTAEVSEETWEVETILDKRIDPTTGGIEYYLKWKNWAGSPTWEPKSNCDCKSLIAKFERELKKRNDSLSQSAASSQLRTPKRQTPARGRKPVKKKGNVLRSSSSSSATYVASEASNTDSRGPTPNEQDNLALVPYETPNTRASRQQTEKRRSARLKKPAVEIITLGDTTSDTEPNNQVEIYGKSYTPTSPQSDNAYIPNRQRARKTPQNRRLPISSQGRPKQIKATKSPAPKRANAPLLNRARSPEQGQLSPSSCSEVDEEVNSFKTIIKKRKLKPKAIVGCIRGDDEISLVVKWHGVPEAEKVPLQIFRKLYCQELLDFLLDKIKWIN